MTEHRMKELESVIASRSLLSEESQELIDEVRFLQAELSVLRHVTESLADVSVRHDDRIKMAKQVLEAIYQS